MEKEEIIKMKDSLWELCDPWESITCETIESLGKEDALHILDFHGENWIEIINKWIPAKYSEEKQNGIIYWQFVTLFKEILWLQFLFQTGNYNLVHRNLRYLLEMMAQAHYIDKRYPDLDYDNQLEMAIELENKKIFGRKLIKIILNDILGINSNDFDKKYGKTLDLLNKHVHASAKRIKIVGDIDPASFFVDSYNEKLAKDTLKVVDEVFDVIYLVVLNRFPYIGSLIAQDRFIDLWAIHAPDTIIYINTH